MTDEQFALIGKYLMKQLEAGHRIELEPVGGGSSFSYGTITPPDGGEPELMWGEPSDIFEELYESAEWERHSAQNGRDRDLLTRLVDGRGLPADRAGYAAEGS